MTAPLASNQRPGTVPEGLVTLSTLSSQLGFLPSSPAWPEVQRAMDRLRQTRTGAPNPEQAQDSRTVAGYARMLKDNMSLLTMALISGMAIGRMGYPSDTSTAGEQLLAGLNALNWARGFGVGDSTAIVQQAWTWVKKEVPSLGDTMMTVDDNWDLEQWATVMEARVGAVVREVSRSAPRVETARSVAWEAWRRRLVTFLGGPPSERSLTGDDLLCHAARVPPATLLMPRLDDMRIPDWSTLVHQSHWPHSGTGEIVPAWAGEMAAVALGFNSTRASELTLPPSRSSAAFSIVIVRRDRDSQTLAWRPTRDSAVLAWTRDQVRSGTIPGVSRAVPPVTQAFPGPPLGIVAIELPAESEEARSFAQLFTSFDIRVFCFDSAGREPPQGLPFFVVQSLDELLAIATDYRSGGVDQVQVERGSPRRKKK